MRSTAHRRPHGEGRGLHPWTRALLNPPRVHDIVAGGRLAAEGAWLPARQDVRGHVIPLPGICRAQFRAALQQPDLFPLVEAHVWNKAWGVHGAHVGKAGGIGRR